jgi:hypothetical protein
LENVVVFGFVIDSGSSLEKQTEIITLQKHRPTGTQEKKNCNIDAFEIIVAIEPNSD